jgi:hypothetical protein
VSGESWTTVPGFAQPAASAASAITASFLN